MTTVGLTTLIKRLERENQAQLERIRQLEREVDRRTHTEGDVRAQNDVIERLRLERNLGTLREAEQIEELGRLRDILMKNSEEQVATKCELEAEVERLRAEVERLRGSGTG